MLLFSVQLCSIYTYRHCQNIKTMRKVCECIRWKKRSTYYRNKSWTRCEKHRAKTNNKWTTNNVHKWARSKSSSFSYHYFVCCDCYGLCSLLLTMLVSKNGSVKCEEPWFQTLNARPFISNTVLHLCGIGKRQIKINQTVESRTLITVCVCVLSLTVRFFGTSLWAQEHTYTTAAHQCIAFIFAVHRIATCIAFCFRCIRVCVNDERWIFIFNTRTSQNDAIVSMWCATAHIIASLRFHLWPPERHNRSVNTE